MKKKVLTALFFICRNPKIKSKKPLHTQGGSVCRSRRRGQGIRLMKNPSEIPFFAVMPPESPVPETGLSFLVSGL